MQASLSGYIDSPEATALYGAAFFGHFLNIARLRQRCEEGAAHGTRREQAPSSTCGGSAMLLSRGPQACGRGHFGRISKISANLRQSPPISAGTWVGPVERAMTGTALGYYQWMFLLMCVVDSAWRDLAETARDRPR